MRKYLVAAFLFLFAFAHAQESTVLTPGAKRLFKINKSKLTNDEKNWLFDQLKITISTTDKRLFKSGENDVTAQAYVTDLNKDGIEEIFMLMQCPALFGDMGTVMMYTKNSKDHFELQSGLGDGYLMILTEKKTGYPDIAVGGPGFEFPVYSWDGKKYKLTSRKVKDSDLQSKKVPYMDVSEANISYLETFK